MRPCEVRTLLVDELRNPRGPVSRQRELPGLPRFPGNGLRIPVAALGTRDAYPALRLEDGRLESRFQPFPPPHWRGDAETGRLPAGFERLAKPCDASCSAFCSKALQIPLADHEALSLANPSGEAPERLSAGAGVPIDSLRALQPDAIFARLQVGTEARTATPEGGRGCATFGRTLRRRQDVTPRSVANGLQIAYCYGIGRQATLMRQVAMTRIGYARVSSETQDLEIQKARLREAGCEIIRAETGSGASRVGRTELRDVLEFLREGDELVVHRLDRLGRSTRDVLNLVHELDGKGASLRVLEPEVTTAGDLGRMVVTVLGMVADMELKFIRDRQRAGIDAAKRKGVYKGRKKQVDEDRIRQLAGQGIPKARIARDLGVSRMSVYRALKSGGGSTA